MDLSISGLHHVTAIAGSPQANVDFYVGFLGLRLVKRTVNFDDPGTYHFYYGDEHGSPGSILTFFPWPHAVPGSAGAGTTRDTAFVVPPGSISFWSDRFQQAGHAFQGPFPCFDERCLAFQDPDGLSLRLVEQSNAMAGPETTARHIPPEYAIRGFHGVSLSVANRTETARLLTEIFGYELVGEEQDVMRLRAQSGETASVVDLVTSPAQSRMGAGVVHHVAFRVPDDDAQRIWQDRLSDAGLHVTDVKDRNYFRSVYFREPGGVLFELATDAPGFSVDEPIDELGRTLKLPPWLEVHRDRIESQLPPVSLPPDA